MNENLLELKKNNPSIELEENGKEYKVLNPWNDESVSFIFKKGKVLTSISNIQFPEELVAIYHRDEQKLEYIYAPLKIGEKDKISINLFNYKGVTFKCYFDMQSNTLQLLCKSFVMNSPDTDSNHRNLRLFRDFFNKTSLYEKFLKDTEPISFFVEGNFTEICNDFVKLSKILNFYRFYFHRNGPEIIIFKKKIKKEIYKKPCYSMRDKFPEIINAKEIDPTLLEIFGVARETKDIRLKFIFYYQILEFVSYYYLNNKIQSNLSNILKRPDVSAKANDYSKKIIEELKDNFSSRNDSKQLESALAEYCSIDDITNEIFCNWEYFSKDIEFDGGFKIQKIINNEESTKNLVEGDFLKVKNNIEKIRNVLVHLRESRENKVILPTLKNNNFLVPYLYIIKRLAEKVAIQFE